VTNFPARYDARSVSLDRGVVVVGGLYDIAKSVDSRADSWLFAGLFVLSFFFVCGILILLVSFSWALLFQM
jgi:hypothetical protein